MKECVCVCVYEFMHKVRGQSGPCKNSECPLLDCNVSSGACSLGASVHQKLDPVKPGQL